MRLLSLALCALLVLVQAELWFGKSGLGRVVGLRTHLHEQQAKNAEAQARTIPVRLPRIGLSLIHI